ncbi:MAG: (2Fe-2S)-binding protein [Acidimicrobiia bacterium]|nr:(2Fe-2S)-binding protein [Acidimicrobiia bacterium]
MSDTLPISLIVNGVERTLEVVPNTSLLDVLRDQLGLTGTKECCVEGECGACTVTMNGRTINSCLTLAVEADGAAVGTVEGLADHGVLSPLQQAFLDTAAPQCGFCIPGQLVSAQALLDSNPNPTIEEIHEALGGNLCRCAGYLQITEAVLQAAGKEATR